MEIHDNDARVESKEDMIKVRKEGKEAHRAQKSVAEVTQEDNFAEGRETDPIDNRGGSLNSAREVHESGQGS